MRIALKSSLFRSKMCVSVVESSVCPECMETISLQLSFAERMCYHIQTISWPTTIGSSTSGRGKACPFLQSQMSKSESLSVTERCVSPSPCSALPMGLHWVPVRACMPLGPIP